MTKYSLYLSISVIFVLLYYLFFSTTSIDLNNQSKRKHQRHKYRGKNNSIGNNKQNVPNKNQPRIAIIIPYIGKYLPPYYPLFAKTASGSSSLVDFLIFHNGIEEQYLPPYSSDDYSNIKLIDLKSTEQMAKQLLRVLDPPGKNYAKYNKTTDELPINYANLEIPYDELVQVLMKHIERYPYVLVEFKSALGHIFSDYISEYTHWGYSDLDIVFGDLPRWITNDELHDFDIVTYSYGDQNRIYLRGQWTFHKNKKYTINQIWRECSFLSQIDSRFARVLEGNKKLHFESAEGCYSQAVLNQKDIKVKYAVKAFTDVTARDAIHTHGLYIATGSQSDRSIIYKAGPNRGDGDQLLSLPMDWFEHEEKYSLHYSSTISNYDDTTLQLQWKIGEPTKIKTHAQQIDENGHSSNDKKNINCMHWVKSMYQADLCAFNVDADDTVFLLNGQLYKQKYAMSQFPGQIQSLPLFHFQEWKRIYRSNQIEPLMHSAELTSPGFVLTKNGVLPIPSVDYIPSPSVVSKQVNAWAKAKNKIHYTDLPTSTFCLRSSARKFPPSPISSECNELASWQDEEYLDIITHGETWENIDLNQDVTLALTLQINHDAVQRQAKLEGLLDIAIENIKIWGNQQPSILLIHVAGATKEAAQFIYDTFEDIIQSAKMETMNDKTNHPFSACLVAIMLSQNTNLVSRKALLNMASAAAPTRFVVSGLELERGFLLSKETQLFAKRNAIIHGEYSGNVFIIPQFASMYDIENKNLVETVGLEEFFKQKSKLNLSPLSEVDCVRCRNGESDDFYKTDSLGIETETSILNSINEIWETFTRFNLVNGDVKKTKEMYDLSKFEKLQIDLINLFQPINEKILRNFDMNPLLMVDNIGPLNGVLTQTVASEVEELGGLRCFNFLRLAQLAVLGYNVQVLPGAFSISFPKSRSAVKAGECKIEHEHDGTGLSRCDGCFMYENFDLIKSIIMDERNRTATTSILWNEFISKHT